MLRIGRALDDNSVPFIGDCWSFAQHRSPQSRLTFHNSSLVNSHDYQRTGDEDPVNAVRNNRAYRSRILPSQNSVEYSPSSIRFVFRIATVDMPGVSIILTDSRCLPYRFPNVIRSRPTPKFGCVAANDFCPLVCFEQPDATREQSSTDQIQKTTRSDDEVFDFHQCTTTIPSSAA